jgi:Ca2+-binding EF-hand superfamily protein
MSAAIRTVVAVAGALALMSCGNSTANKQQAQAAQDVEAPYAYTIYGTFADWDTDGDKQLSLAEIQKGVDESGLFAAWDVDGDGKISEIEFWAGMFAAWDLDADNSIDLYEFNAGHTAWLPEWRVYGRFSDWDEDNDKELSLLEFRDGVATTTVFDDWDTNNDSYLTSDEYSRALIGAWDADGDGQIEMVEYGWG